MADSAFACTEAGIRALVTADAEQLRRLAAGAAAASPPGTEAERKAAAMQLQALKRLLALTRRNLRLLRAAYRISGGYGTDEPDQLRGGIRY